MHRVRWLLVFALLLIPGVANAIQLHWNSGADTLTFTEATRAILVLRADSAEVTLPPEWRLLWVGDSTEVEVVALDSVEMCDGDTAQVYGVDGPSTPEDSTAHRVTAHFCSGGSSAAEQAVFQLDLPAWGRGKCKVVALDPADSTAVLESNEVTFNGGVADDYSPVLLAATSTHPGELLTVTAIGCGLTDVSSISVGAADDLWNVPLSIASVSNSRVVATAQILTQLPASVVKTQSARGPGGTASLAAEQFNEDMSSLAYTSLYTDASPKVYPKDFAFVFNTIPTTDPQHPWQSVFHLFYIRHFKSGAEPYIAHAWSTDLVSWNRGDSLDFLPGPAWDSKHVWAPSIIKIGNLFYMFYAGVDDYNNQRLGYVTATHLDAVPNWSTNDRKMIYDADSTGWVSGTPAARYGNAQQFRDPFIMEDPDTAGRYILYQVGEDKNFEGLGPTAVGVAKNRPGTLDRWLDFGVFRNTDSTHVGVQLQPVKSDSACFDPPPPDVPIIESPMAMQDSLTHAWRIFFTNGLYNCTGTNSTWFVTADVGVPPADTTLGHWSGLTNLYPYLGNNNELLGWAAMKHLRVGSKWHFFAAYDGDGIRITQAHWDTSAHTFVISQPSLAGVRQGGSPAAVRFCLSEFRPGAATVRLFLESPEWAVPRLVIYDVAGRKIRTLAEGAPMIGTREYVWDLRDGAGSAVGSGIYFVRLTGVGKPTALRVPVVR
jgi:hypothetical protein